MLSMSYLAIKSDYTDKNSRLKQFLIVADPGTLIKNLSVGNRLLADRHYLMYVYSSSIPFSSVSILVNLTRLTLLLTT
jgi:hypothetical protein